MEFPLSLRGHLIGAERLMAEQNLPSRTSHRFLLGSPNLADTAPSGPYLTFGSGIEFGRVLWHPNEGNKYAFEELTVEDGIDRFMAHYGLK